MTQQTIKGELKYVSIIFGEAFAIQGPDTITGMSMMAELCAVVLAIRNLVCNYVYTLVLYVQNH